MNEQLPFVGKAYGRNGVVYYIDNIATSTYCTRITVFVILY